MPIKHHTFMYRHIPSTALLFGAFVALSIASCKKGSEDPAPPAGNGPNIPAACQYNSHVTDIDGNEYPVTTIGSQQWMAADLRTTRYRNGSAIPNVTDNTAWSELSTGAWCNYLNEPANDTIYVKIYNWYAASNPDICPQGWHLPTDAEWKQLEITLGMTADDADLFHQYRGGGQNVAGKLKAVSTLWLAPANTNLTNESCFSALPGGYREDENGFYYGLGGGTGWWTATAWESNPTEAAYYRSVSGFSGVVRSIEDHRIGRCLRCVMD